jgi:hypothetical protein
MKNACKHFGCVFVAGDESNQIWLLGFGCLHMLFGAIVVYIVQPLRDAAAANFSTESLAPLMFVAALLSAFASYIIGVVFAGRSSQEAVVLFHRMHGVALLCFFATRPEGPVFFLYASVASALMMSMTWGFAAEVGPLTQLTLAPPPTLTKQLSPPPLPRPLLRMP